MWLAGALQIRLSLLSNGMRGEETEKRLQYIKLDNNYKTEQNVI